MTRTAIVLVVPEAEPLVGALRLLHDPMTRLGVPAHVTLLFPFAPIERVDEGAVARSLGGAGAIDVVFDRVAHFPDVAYLAPVDPAPMIALTRRLAAAFPAYPPYEGRFADIVPHLTIGHGTFDVDDVARQLPLVARVTDATLLAEDDGGRWRVHARYAL